MSKARKFKHIPYKPKKTKSKPEADWESGYKILDKKLEDLDRVKFYLDPYNWKYVIKRNDFIGQIKDVRV